MELYKKFSYQNQSSYSLNYIGLQEVGEGKLDFEGQINDLWSRDWERHIKKYAGNNSKQLRFING
jgi:hypothetical protein